MALKTTRILWLFRESLALGLIATQVLGNSVNLLLGRIAEVATGLAVAGALLSYLLRPRVKIVFLTAIHERPGSDRS